MCYIIYLAIYYICCMHNLFVKLGCSIAIDSYPFEFWQEVTLPDVGKIAHYNVSYGANAKTKEAISQYKCE